MPTRSFSDAEYREAFKTMQTGSSHSIHANALERALEIRKFEIELYWKRAAYFWTFIAATLAGFVAIQASSVATNKELLSVLLCNLGITFSAAWLCANRGSKHWQENWENHVDMLEDPIQGPLYKVVLTRAAPKGIQERVVHMLTGPSPISVSKINQLISLYVLVVWIGLLKYSLPEFGIDRPIHWPYFLISFLTFCVCCAFFFGLGRTYQGGYWHQGTIRTSKINNPVVSSNANQGKPVQIS